MNPDVIGVNEIENDGYGPDSALAHLVGKLNAATAPGTYAYVDADAETGQVDALGTDAIKVGQIYKPAEVTRVGKTAVLNSVEFVNGGDSAPRTRPSLAQAYKVNATGGVFIADINHFKSKGSGCDADPPGGSVGSGDGQGNCALVREAAAKALAGWLASDPTGTGDQDVLLLGDYNSYSKEKSIVALEAGGYTNLIADLVGPDAYSYVFDGQWGYLDYALGSQSIRSQVTGVVGVPHQLRRALGARLQHQLQVALAGRVAVCARPVPRLRPRPGRRRAVAQLAGHGDRGLRGRLGVVRCGERQPDGRHHRPGCG